MSVLKKIGNVVINILIVIVLVVSVVIAVLALTSRANGGVPSLLGYSFHTIQTSSMEGGSDEYDGGDYLVGDLVIGKVTDGNPNEVYEPGDIVVYTTRNDEAPSGVDMIVHRIIEREEDNNGTYLYTTKGDNNDIADEAKHYASQIVAVCYDHNYQGKVLKGFGKALDYIRTSQGFFFVVLLPMIIFFLYEIVRVVLNAVNYRNAKAKEEIEQMKDEQQAAIDAAVAAALAAVNNNEAKDESPAPVPQAAPAVAETPAAEIPAEKPAEESAAEKSAETASPEMTAEQMEQFKQFLAFQEAQKKKDNG